MDAYLSYAGSDREWVEVLSRNLEASGVRVFLDEWEIGPGDVVLHRLEEGLRQARTGVIVVSSASLGDARCREEYAVLLQKAQSGRGRLIPVLYGETEELPAFLSIRAPVDFRGAVGPTYLARLGALVRAIRGEGAVAAGGIELPASPLVRPEGALRRRLRVTATESQLYGGPTPVVGAVTTLATSRLDELHWSLWSARRAAGSADEQSRGGAAVAAERLLSEIGEALGNAFLPGDVGSALATALAQADQTGSVLELALEVADERLAPLAWEALRVPGLGGDGALVLHPRVQLFRAVPPAGPVVTPAIPGPLRILVAIGSPEEQNARGELLDMERELQRILDAVDPLDDAGALTPRLRSRAHVHILEFGTTKAIRAALDAARYHVLYLSCHAGPGVLVLEDEDGGEHRVSARDLVDEAIPPGRPVPLVVLAGCSTGVARTSKPEQAGNDGATRQDRDAETETHLPGVAQGLLAAGIPMVLAMQAPVGDRYASELAAGLFRGLVGKETPDALRAFTDARRALELLRRAVAAKGGSPALPEWATPTLYVSGPVVELYDRGRIEPIPDAPPPDFASGIPIRQVGTFAGRRREQRALFRRLTTRGHHDECAGVVLHGMGGVGKSTLAARLLERCHAAGWLLVSVVGRTSPDEVLSAVASRLAQASLQHGWPDDHPVRRAIPVLKEVRAPWGERWQVVRPLLASLPLLLFLDNFEDNLEEARTVRDEGLAGLLSAWTQQAGRRRVLITSRYPFALPDHADASLTSWHLGPLTPAETRKLLWRLPGLDALSPEERAKAVALVGGHPRIMEYLDALLRGGAARFGDIAVRMTKALERRGVSDVAGHLRAHAGKLDAAMAEAVALAADDVLLDDLLAAADEVPLARQLILRAAVYRMPVDHLGLAWQLVEEFERPKVEVDPRVGLLVAELQKADAEKREPDLSVTGMTAQEIPTLLAAVLASRAPPLTPPPGLDAATFHLQHLTLLAPSSSTGSEGKMFAIHRWTADALARQLPLEVRADAHRRAARYWRWRVDTLPRRQEIDLEEVLEARHHFRAAGDVLAACLATENACTQLDTWGAWEREDALATETLNWPDLPREKVAIWLGQRGIIAHKRGDYDAAHRGYEQSLAIFVELGHPAGIARTYHSLGVLSQDRGDLDAATDWYRRSLKLSEERGDRANMAGTYHQLGIINQKRGKFEEALDWYGRSLTIKTTLNDRAGMAKTYHQIGIVAQLRGDYIAALDWYRKSLGIEQEMGNRSGMASSYHHLGIVAQLRGDSEGALSWYRKSLAISEELGDRASMASSYHHIGMIAHGRGEFDSALGWYQMSLSLHEQIGNPAGSAGTYGQLGQLAVHRGAPVDAIPFFVRALSIFLELQSPDARIALDDLADLRKVLGATTFNRELREHVDETSAAALSRWLDQLPPEEGEPQP